MNKKKKSHEIQTIDPVFLNIYEICESHGVSKGIISGFLRLKGDLIQHAQHSKRT